MKYSVVATSFNDSADIVKYLEDICNQTYLPDEIVIADGGSKDDTVEKIRNFATTSNVKIHVLEKGRLNISQGYNEAIKASVNEVIGITGIGNFYDKSFFELLVKELENNNLDYAYSPIRGYNANRFSTKYNRALLNGEDGNCLSIASNHGALLKKSIFVDLDFFYEKFIYAGEDAEFYALVKKHGYKGKLVKEAKVYWKTPISWKEFLKQIRVYTVADLQIDSKTQRKKIGKQITKLLLMIAAIVLGIIILFSSCRVMFKGMYGLFVIAVVIIKRKQLNILRFTNTYLPIFYTIKYKKYMNEEYAVRRKDK